MFTCRQRTVISPPTEEMRKNRTINNLKRKKEPNELKACLHPDYNDPRKGTDRILKNENFGHRASRTNGWMKGISGEEKI